MRAAHHAGYQKVRSRVVGLKDVTKVPGLRWPAIVTRVRASLPVVISMGWAKQGARSHPSPVTHLPAAARTEMRLPEEVVRMAKDPDYFKSKSQIPPSVHDFDFLQLRT